MSDPAGATVTRSPSTLALTRAIGRRGPRRHQLQVTLQFGEPLVRSCDDSVGALLRPLLHPLFLEPAILLDQLNRQPSKRSGEDRRHREKQDRQTPACVNRPSTPADTTSLRAGSNCMEFVNDTRRAFRFRVRTVRVLCLVLANDARSRLKFLLLRCRHAVRELRQGGGRR